MAEMSGRAVGASEDKHAMYTRGEHDILLRLGFLERDLKRGAERFGDHEMRLRSLERRFWMALGVGMSLLVALEALALAGITR